MLCNTSLCSFLVLGLNKFITVYSESLTEISMIKMRSALSVCCFFNSKSFLSKLSSQDPKGIFSMRKKNLTFKVLFTLLLDSCRNKTQVGPILFLKYWISFILCLYDCTSSTLLITKLRLLFGNMRSSKLLQLLNYAILMGN